MVLMLLMMLVLMVMGVLVGDGEYVRFGVLGRPKKHL
jgi:hypothetical protein